jgi:hypothetical protein
MALVAANKNSSVLPLPLHFVFEEKRFGVVSWDDFKDRERSVERIILEIPLAEDGRMLLEDVVKIFLHHNPVDDPVSVAKRMRDTYVYGSRLGEDGEIGNWYSQAGVLLDGREDRVYYISE